MLEVAARLFFEQGYLATGVNQLIADAGVAKASFYKHFPSKELLATEVLRETESRLNQELGARIEQEKEPVARVLACFDFLRDFAVSSDFRGCAFQNLASEFPGGDDELRQMVRRHKQSLCDLFIELAEKVPVPACSLPAEKLGRTLFLLFEGALLESRIFRSTWPIDNARETAEGLL